MRPRLVEKKINLNGWWWWGRGRERVKGQAWGMDEAGCSAVCSIRTGAVGGREEGAGRLAQPRQNPFTTYWSVVNSFWMTPTKLLADGFTHISIGNTTPELCLPNTVRVEFMVVWAHSHASHSKCGQCKLRQVCVLVVSLAVFHMPSLDVCVRACSESR